MSKTLTLLSVNEYASPVDVFIQNVQELWHSSFEGDVTLQQLKDELSAQFANLPEHLGAVEEFIEFQVEEGLAFDQIVIPSNGAASVIHWDFRNKG
jgi:hypothetical protein